MKKRNLLAAFVATVAFAAVAQYSISWQTVDGGGGTASGGDYVLNGTIGQPDSGNMNGGDFTVRGGFWVPQAIQVEGAPYLSIVALSAFEVELEWGGLSNWALQQTTNLQSNWVDCASGITNPITIPTTEASMFYRLRRK